MTATRERLIFVDLKENHNKFWHADLDGTTLVLEWGRVDDAKHQTKPLTFETEEKAEKEFRRRLNSKLREGYTRQQTIGDKRPANVAWVAKVQIKHNNDAETSKLIDFLVQRNIHAIEGTTSIRLESGQLTTPLGPVTNEGLDAAQILLHKMSTRASDFDDLVNQYLRIVPRSIGRSRIKTDPRDLFGAPRQIEAEQAMLDSLRAVVKDIEQKASTDGPPVFQTNLTIIDPKDIDFKQLNKAFRASLNRNHQSYGMNLQRVWEMQITSAEAAFESRIGNIKRLWHGTKDANLLSILKNGYIIPRRNSGITITGRMFGDGIYFSDQSTKSLNYASGFWGGGRSQRCFMLYNDVAMGKEYMATHGFSGTVPRGYDSCFAKAGTTVRNNEMIVYRASQIKPIFLCEFA